MKGGRRLRMAIGAAMALVLLGSACAKKTITPGAGGATTPQSTAGTGTSGGYGGYGGYGGRGGTSSTPSSVATGTAVQQGSAGGALVFSPTSLSVKQGVTIMVSDVGTTQHTFTITGKGIDVVNNPGQTQSVAINLAPGTYQFICRFHVGFGMKGTLTVTA
jgi:plastocyanin